MGAETLQGEVVRLLGERVYSAGDQSMEEVVGALFVRRGLTVGIAESCTGGLVTHRLTNVPGSSAYLRAGIVAYSNESKIALLGVDPSIIRNHGAVSAETASAMAEGIRRVSGADIGVSTTGIAGPGGGSELKPVGLMYAGFANRNGTKTNKLHFAEERIINKSRMSQAILDILRIHLERDI